jgi:hypothetical protein
MNINIAGEFHYYDRNTKSVTSARTVRGESSYYDKAEAEVMRDLAAAIELRDNLEHAVRNMRKLLEEGQV